MDTRRPNEKRDSEKQSFEGDGHLPEISSARRLQREAIRPFGTTGRTESREENGKIQIIHIYTGGMVEAEEDGNRRISEAAAGVRLLPIFPVSSIASLAAGVQTSGFAA